MQNYKNLSNKKILITGASGFIGSHLLRRLKKAGSKIYAISRNDTNPNDKDIHWMRADVSDIIALKSIFEKVKPDIVFHLASHVSGNRDIKQIDLTFKSNLLSTVNLLILVTQFNCERLITIGSMEEPDVASDGVPSSPYAAAKWASTGYCRMFFHLYHTPVVVAKLFMVYGPDQKDTTKLIPYVTTSLLQNIPPKLASGKREVDWIYIDDVVEGLLKLSTAPGVIGEIIEIGSGQANQIRTVVEKLVRIIKPNVLPLFHAIEDRPMEQVRVADIKKNQKFIYWKPSVSLDRGLARTVDWYKKHES